MPRNLTIVLPDRPGALAAAWDRLKDAGVNIDGACGFPQRGQTWVLLHILVADGEAARSAVESAGFEVINERDVAIHQMEDRPGALAEIFQEYLAQGRNVDLMYLASNNRAVIGCDDDHEERRGFSTLGEQR